MRLCFFFVGEQSEKNPGCSGSIGDEKLPSYAGIKINQYKDPYEATSILFVFFGNDKVKQTRTAEIPGTLRTSGGKSPTSIVIIEPNTPRLVV